MEVEGDMSATVICFESFRIERDRRRTEAVDEVETPARAPFLREPGVPLTVRQIAHRQTMLDYWNQRRRAMFGLFSEVAFREAATERE
jgi:hypothetical protein